MDLRIGALRALRGIRALTLELFGTSTLFARHWEQFADSLRFEARHVLPHMFGHTTGQTARDFVAALATDPRGLAAGPTRSHGNVASTPVRAAVGRFAYSGLAVQRPGRRAPTRPPERLGRGAPARLRLTPLRPPVQHSPKEST